MKHRAEVVKYGITCSLWRVSLAGGDWKMVLLPRNKGARAAINAALRGELARVVPL